MQRVVKTCESRWRPFHYTKETKWGGKIRLLYLTTSSIYMFAFKVLIDFSKNPRKKRIYLHTVIISKYN